MIGVAKIFKSIQGEGLLCGMPMVFVRTSGCSIGCPECDTDYRMKERLTVTDVVSRVLELAGNSISWVWLTGGEPLDWDDSIELSSLLRKEGLKTALATSGKYPVVRSQWDFISVSPHHPINWVQRGGDQLNVVHMLNGVHANDMLKVANGCLCQFNACYITPLYGNDQSECIEIVNNNHGWRLGLQAHKIWGVE